MRSRKPAGYTVFLFAAVLTFGCLSGSNDASQPPRGTAEAGRPDHELTATNTAWTYASDVRVLSDDFDPKWINHLVVTPHAVWSKDYDSILRISTDGKSSHIGTERLPGGNLFNTIATPRGVVIASERGMTLLDDQNGSSLDEQLLDSGTDKFVHSATYHQGRLFYLVTTRGKSTELGILRISDLLPKSEKIRRRQLANHLRQILPGGQDWLLAETPERTWVTLNIRELEQGQEPLSSTPIPAAASILNAISIRGRSFVLTENGLQEVRAPGMEPVDVFPFDPGKATGLAAARDESGIWLLDQKTVRRFNLQTNQIDQRLALPEESAMDRGSRAWRNPLLYVAVAEDGIGRIWVSSSLGLLVSDPVHSRLVAGEKAGVEVPHAADSVRALGFAQDGSVWLGEDQRVRMLGLSAAGDRAVKTREPVDYANTLADGRLVIATGSGVHVQEGDGWSAISGAAKGDWSGLDQLENQRQLLSAWLRKPLLARQLLQYFSPKQLLYFQSSRTFLERLETKFDRSALLAAPWNSYRISTTARGDSAQSSEEHLLIAPWPGGTPELLFLNHPGQKAAGPSLRSQRLNQYYEAMVREPATGDYFSIGNDGLSRFSSAQDEFAAYPTPAPCEQDGSTLREALVSRNFLRAKQRMSPPHFDKLLASQIDPAGMVLIADQNRLYERTAGQGAETDWQLRLEMAPADKDKAIVGLLPDPQGGGALVGCERCTPHSLFHVSGDGSAIVPVALNDQKVGVGNNALLRDSKGRTWLAAEKGLYLRMTESSPFKPFNRPDGSQLELDVNSIVEDREGKIWLAANTSRETLSAASTELRSSKLAGEEGKLDPGALWVIDKDQVHREHQFTQLAVSLALVEGAAPENDQLWVCGDNLLFTIPLRQPKNKKDMLSLLEKTLSLGDNSGRAGILRCTADGNGILILSKQGLVSVTAGRWQRIALPEALRREAYDQRGTLIRTFADHDGNPHGKAIVSLGNTYGRSQIWLRASAKQAFTRLRSTSWIGSVAALADGTLLAGTEAGQVMQLGVAQEFVPKWSLIPREADNGQPIGPISRVCPLDAATTLVVGQDPRPLIVSRTGRRWFSSPVTLWTSCVALSSTQALLQHERGVSLLTLGTGSPAQRDQVIDVELEGVDGKRPQVLSLSGEVLWPQRSDRQVVLLTNDFIYLYDRKTAKFRQAGPTPKQFSHGGEHGTALVIAKEIWIRTEINIYRRQLADGAWQVLDEIDGVPPEVKRATFFDSGRDEQGNHKVLLITSGGDSGTAVRNPSGTWLFAMNEQPALAGSHTVSSELFSIDRQMVLAISTDQACIMMPYDPEHAALHQEKGLRLNQAHGVDEDFVVSLRWAPKAQRLFVATSRRITSLKVSWKDNKLSAQKEDSLAGTSADHDAPTLPSGNVIDMQVDADGRNVWLALLDDVSSYRDPDRTWLVRWNLPAKRVSQERLGSAVGAMLGPVVNGQTPRILLLDPQLRWSLWQPAAYRTPKLAMKGRFSLWSWLSVDPGSLNPSDDQMSGWDVRYRMAQSGTGWTRWPLLREPSVWKYEKEYRIEAELYPRAEGALRYAASLSVTQSYEEWLWQRSLLFIVSLSSLLFAAVYIRRRIIRRRRLLAHQIPYIQGESIQDPAKFFGREELMAELRDGLANGSFALTGEFRIGKTSIQRQLNQQIGRASCRERVSSPV